MCALALDHARAGAPGLHRALIENREAAGPLVLVCEHASAEIPAPWGDLGLSPEARLSHAAWDIGALDLARALMRRLDAVLVHAPISRLVYDLNRAPDQAGAMPERSEVHDVPGNAGLTAAERAARTHAVYVPFHDDLHIEVSRRMALGLAPVLVTVHSFTPVWFGQPRAVEFGVIHDADDRLARALAAQETGLATGLNAPYSAADGVTHTLRLHATPYGLANAMLEIRNDLIATPEAAEAMAGRLAPAIRAAAAAIGREV
jgi:predicted N-formylglutamate amidohydrolase